MLFKYRRLEGSAKSVTSFLDNKSLLLLKLAPLAAITANPGDASTSLVNRGIYIKLKSVLRIQRLPKALVVVMFPFKIRIRLCSRCIISAENEGKARVDACHSISLETGDIIFC